MKWKNFAVIIIFLMVVYFIFGKIKPKNENYTTLNFKENDVLELSGVLSQTINESTDDYHYIYVSMSKNCTYCKKFLKIASMLDSILSKQRIGIKFIWDKKPDKLMLDKYSIDNNENLILEKGVKMENSYPTYFLTDSNNLILKKTSEFHEMFVYIMELESLNLDKLVSNTDEYLISNIFKDVDKRQMLYFSMEGCPDCIAADNIIDRLEIRDWEIEKIFTADSENNGMKDEFGILSKIYNVDWFPSFLYWDGNKFEKISTEDSIELEKNLKGIIER